MYPYSVGWFQPTSAGVTLPGFYAWSFGTAMFTAILILLIVFICCVIAGS